MRLGTLVRFLADGDEGVVVDNVGDLIIVDFDADGLQECEAHELRVIGFDRMSAR